MRRLLTHVVATSSADSSTNMTPPEFANPTGRNSEVHLEPVPEEDAPLREPANRSRLDERQQRLAEQPEPVAVAQVAARVVREEDDVGVLVRRRLLARLGA